MWNERYRSASFAYGKEPNTFFKESLKAYKVSGNVLFPAEGEGRNAVYGAKSGVNAFAFDISEEGKKKALDLAAAEKVQIEYTVGDFMAMDFINESFDAAVLIYAHFPPTIVSEYHQKIGGLLKEDGLIILEGFSKNNLPYRAKNPGIGGPKVEEMLFSTDSVTSDFPDFEILQLEEVEIELKEGAFHNGIGKVIRFIGRKKTN